MSINSALDTEVQNRVESIDKERCIEWGGNIVDGTPQVTEIEVQTDFRKKTTVRSVDDGLDAFKRYSEYLDYILSERSKSNDTAILIPCGKQKPIGASAIHRKKLTALKDSELSDNADIRILSEPCTIIPHDMRLTLPAVNYDFPPKFTEEGKAQPVFDVFTDKLATWLEERDYDVIYAYLVKRHQNKLNTAIEKADVDTTVIKIPGASYNPDTGKYSGDLFKSQDDMTAKVEFVRAIRGEDSDKTIEELRNEYSEETVNFYLERL